MCPSDIPPNYRSRFFCTAMVVVLAALSTDARSCTGTATSGFTVNFGTLVARPSFTDGTAFLGDNPKTSSISLSCPPVNNPAYPAAVVTYADSVSSSGSWGPSGVAGAYRSGISGVGVAVTASGPGVTYPVMNYVTPTGTNCSYGSTMGVFCQSYGTVGGTFNYQQNLGFRLVKVAGTVPVGPFYLHLMDMRIQTWIPGQGSGPSPYIVSSVYGTGTFVSPTCTVNTPSQIVTLDDASATQLSTVGATAGTKAFNLSLNCQGGMTVLTTFTDNAAPGNTTNVLTNNVAATQAGVGLQILRSGLPVNFGSAMTIATIATDNTPVTIPMEARYIRKAGTLTAGEVQGVFTYTLTYQ